MNTRLLELAKKAGLHHRYDEYQDISYVTNEELFEQERHVNDKRLIEILTPFTELIVRECAEQIIAKGTDWVDFAPSQTGVRPEYRDMAQHIKQHFGIE